MVQLTFSELVKAINDANVRIIKQPNQRVQSDSPRGALLDALNRVLANKSKTQE